MHVRRENWYEYIYYLFWSKRIYIDFLILYFPYHPSENSTKDDYWHNTAKKCYCCIWNCSICFLFIFSIINLIFYCFSVDFWSTHVNYFWCFWFLYFLWFLSFYHSNWDILIPEWNIWCISCDESNSMDSWGEWSWFWIIWDKGLTIFIYPCIDNSLLRSW